MIQTKQVEQVTVLRTGRNIVCKLAGYYAYCFLIGGTLIDTSTRYVEKELVSELQKTNVSRIINTHYHEDHAGNNKALQEALGLEIFACPQSLPLMEAPQTEKQRFYLKLMWGYPEPSQGIPLPEIAAFDDYTFEVISTPGHTLDHVCLYEPKHKYLFTGDMYCGTAVKYLRGDENFGQQLESMRKLAALDVDTIFCSVSGAVTNGGRALKDKLDFMEQLQEKVLELNRQGLSSTEIRSSLLGKEGIMYWFTNGHFAKQNLIDSIIGNDKGQSSLDTAKDSNEP